MNIITTNGLDCIPPEPGLPYDYVYDLSLKPKIGWGIEWWYYVLNLNADMEYYPSITITTFAIRTPLTTCESKNNQLFEMYIGITSPIFDDITYTETTIIDIENSVNEEYLNITTENTAFIRYPNTNYTWIRFGNNQIMLEDGRGYFLQGEGGFSKSGPFASDNYYAGNFMRMKVTGLLENGLLMTGVGYGEHVFGSPISSDPPYNPYDGWHCHYIHSAPNIIANNTSSRYYKDLQFCASIKKDGSVDNYSHGLFINEKDERINIRAEDIFFYYTNVWDNIFPLNWTYYFINPNITIPTIQMYPIQNMYNQTHTFDNTTWWDGGITTVAEDYFGILELVDFKE